MLSAIDAIYSIRFGLWRPVSTIHQIILKVLHSAQLCDPTCFQPFCQFYIALSNQISNFEAIDMDMEAPILIEVRF
jgi:hypothetical protein